MEAIVIIKRERVKTILLLLFLLTLIFSMLELKMIIISLVVFFILSILYRCEFKSMTLGVYYYNGFYANYINKDLFLEIQQKKFYFINIYTLIMKKGKNRIFFTWHSTNIVKFKNY